MIFLFKLTIDLARLAIWDVDRIIKSELVSIFDATKTSFYSQMVFWNRYLFGGKGLITCLVLIEEN